MGVDHSPRAAAPSSERQGLRARARRLVVSNRFEAVIVTVVVINAVILGLETSASARNAWGPTLRLLDWVCLTIFVVELALRLFALGRDFWRSPWSVFDLVVVAIALIPASGPFAMLRALRVLRVFRLVSVLPSLRKVVGALASAIPGIGAIAALLSVVFYVGAVMSTSLFGQSHPQWFGTIGRSMYTLFQIMTLESWSMGIVRPVMEVHPWAWAFFVPFILVTSFTVLNLFIAVIVDSMSHLRAAEAEEAGEEVSIETVQRQLDELHDRLRDISGSLVRLEEKERGQR